MAKKDYGVIQEQGFVAGYGLGFSKVNEQELNPNKNKLDDNKKDKESKDSKKNTK